MIAQSVLGKKFTQFLIGQARPVQMELTAHQTDVILNCEAKFECRYRVIQQKISVDKLKTL